MQTALAALCYFCENHGPRVVFTCQPMRTSDLDLEGLEKAKCSSNFDDSTFSLDGIPYFCNDLYGGNEIVDDELRCAACSSFVQGMGLLSDTSDEEISYVSSQVPINERLNQILKQASLRSLSVEVSAPFVAACTSSQSSPQLTTSSTTSSNSQKDNDEIFFGYSTSDSEHDGVVLFGDDENWYTLSYTFRLRDAKARGFHRSYSLVVVCMDKLLLLRHYDFLTNSLCSIVSKLQEITNTFFIYEQAQDSELRLASNVKNAHWLPHQFYPRQYAVDTSRSLKIITNDENIFTLLHSQMISLLKTLTSLDKDILLEGCPTQEMLFVTELSVCGSLEEKELINQLSSKQTLIQLDDLRYIAQTLAEQDSALLNALIWQIIIGEQIVVKCNSLIARQQFIHSLVQLLPIGCVRLDANATQYYHSYKYNFLGCSPEIEIPSNYLSNIFLLILSENDKKEDELNKDDKQEIQTTNLNKFNIFVGSFPQRRESEKPTLVKRYSQLLLDSMINGFTLESALRATRNEWLNNVKLIFQLRHQRETIDLQRIMRIIKCRSQDSPVILFWQKGLSKRYKHLVLKMAKFNENGEENGLNCISSKKTQKTSKQRNKEEDLVVDNCNV
uniref:Folliculin n=2 Tax=Meloidogyne incognita group TaxID=654580 RepID=A0A914L1V5_MELIC